MYDASKPVILFLTSLFCQLVDEPNLNCMSDIGGSFCLSTPENATSRFKTCFSRYLCLISRFVIFVPNPYILSRLTGTLARNWVIFDLESCLSMFNGYSTKTMTSSAATVTSVFIFPASLTLKPCSTKGSKFFRHSLNFESIYLSNCFSIELSVCLKSGLFDANLQSPLQLFADFMYHQ